MDVISEREPAAVERKNVLVDAWGRKLEGVLSLPTGAVGLVIFAHGSGSSRWSPRNRQVATALNRHRLATLLFDLLTAEEGREDQLTARLRFDIGLLTERLTGTVEWAARHPLVKHLPIGLFGASTGAAAALASAAERPDLIRAVVSRGGRPDLAGDTLRSVRAPVLLIVGELDSQVIDLNREAADWLKGDYAIEIIPDAGHLFEQPGALEQVSARAAAWFTRFLD